MIKIAKYNELDLMAVEYQTSPNDKLLENILSLINKKICYFAKKYSCPPIYNFHDMKQILEIQIWKQIPKYEIDKSSFLTYSSIVLENTCKSIAIKINRQKIIPKRLIIPITETWSEKGTISQNPDYKNWQIEYYQKEQVKDFLKWCQKKLSKKENSELVKWIEQKFGFSQMMQKKPALSKSNDNSLTRIKRKVKWMYDLEKPDFHLFEENAIVNEFAIQTNYY